MTDVKTLIHVHTNYSFDSDIPVESLARFARREGIGCIAVTDHDTIEGARKLAEIADFRVIIGEEISTRDGHLIGLFLKRRIEPGMSARRTAIAIREQGGLVLLPHPFVTAFGCGLNDASWTISDLIDAVEVNNAQNLLPGPDRKAEAFASELALPRFVGADTHSVTSIAPCFQIMPDCETPAAFLAALASATLVRGRHPLRYFAAAATRIARHLAGMALPRGFGVNAECNHRASGRVSADSLALAN